MTLLGKPVPWKSVSWFTPIAALAIVFTMIAQGDSLAQTTQPKQPMSPVPILPVSTGTTLPPPQRLDSHPNPTNRELLELLKAQQRQIDALRKALEQQNTGKPPERGDAEQTPKGSGNRGSAQPKTDAGKSDKEGASKTETEGSDKEAKEDKDDNATSEPDKSEDEAGDPTFSAFWNNGLRFKTKDEDFKVHVGGRLHLDMLWWKGNEAVQFGPGGVGMLNDGTNFRRARIRVDGRMYDAVEWAMEYGFESGETGFFDVYSALPDLPYLGTFQIGHFREPFSMDALTSGNSLTFMERSLLHEALVPFRNVGLMFSNTALDEAATWAVGGFYADTNRFGFQGQDGAYAFTGRITANPWYDADGGNAFHLGLAGSYRALPELVFEGQPEAISTRGFRLATRPEIRVTAPNFADTGMVPGGDPAGLFGLEMGLGLGPLLFQAEYVASFTNNVPFPTLPASFGSVFFSGFYVQASYLLTGENRPYNRRSAVFGQVIPRENFIPNRRDPCCDPCRSTPGRGAWEAAIRYSQVDLNSGGIAGGDVRDISLGLNWYLNPNSRVMCNYILIFRDTIAGTSDGLTQALGARFQVDF